MEVYKCDKDKEIGVMQNDIQTLYRRVDRIEDVQNSMNELITNVALLADNMKGIREDITEVKKDVNILKRAPSDEAKEFKKTVRNVTITFILTAILTYIATGLGG